MPKENRAWTGMLRRELLRSIEDMNAGEREMLALMLEKSGKPRAAQTIRALGSSGDQAAKVFH